MVIIFLFLIVAALFGFCLIKAWRRYRVYYYAWCINLPKPKYTLIIEKNVMVPMKDGTKLATDVYRPNAWRKFPVILIRTPYEKSGSMHPYKQMAEVFACQGYAVVVQDVRGKFDSEGAFYPYAYEALDGHTTVTWAGEAPWSNGNVGFLGISYLGSCAWLAARYKSPYLRTMITMFTTQNTYSIWIDRGIPFLKGPLFWLGNYGRKTTVNVTSSDVASALWTLPVVNQDEKLLDQKIPFFKDYLQHPYRDAFWNEISVQPMAENLDIPVYVVGGWYDPFIRGTIEDYHYITSAPPESRNHYSKLEIGPWGHNPNQKFRGVYFGRKAEFNALIISKLEWFDIWLKKTKSIPKDSKKVKYFIMGKNIWKESDQWPPSNISYEKYYLSLDANLKSLLSPIETDAITQRCFIYNPLDPVFFRGSYILDNDSWIEQTEQNEIEQREDVLIYSSAPMETDFTIAGTAKLILYVSSKAQDTDFCVKICDLHPNGKAYNISTGFLRMRYRESMAEPKLMEPDKVYSIEITFKPVANTFLKNHCIQLQITSSDFPVHDRNLNTGYSNESSVETKETTSTVFAGGPYNSHLLLPVLEE